MMALAVFATLHGALAAVCVPDAVVADRPVTLIEAKVE
jgi:hypothetical protein